MGCIQYVILSLLEEFLEEKYCFTKFSRRVALFTLELLGIHPYANVLV